MKVTRPPRPCSGALAAALFAAALAAPAAAANPGVGANDPSPIAGAPLYVDAFEQPTARASRAALADGRTGEAATLRKMARHSIFRWIGKTDENPERAARNFLTKKVLAEQPGSVPGITVLNHVGERCGGGYDAGGSADAGRYRRWIDRFAAGVGGHRVIIAFEPDSLGTLTCMTPRGRRARLRNMRYGIDRLSRLPNATIYIEATASDWRPAREVARYLRFVGVSKVRGFMLNATHQDLTSRNVRYGQRLSRLVGGKHFVVNTAENGSGNLFVRGAGGGASATSSSTAIPATPHWATHPPRRSTTWAGPCRRRSTATCGSTVQAPPAGPVASSCAGTRCGVARAPAGSGSSGHCSWPAARSSSRAERARAGRRSVGGLRSAP